MLIRGYGDTRQRLVDFNVLKHQLETTIKQEPNKILEVDQSRLVLFNPCFPVDGQEVAQILAILLDGKVVDRDSIRQLAADDQERSRLWGMLSPRMQRFLSKDGDCLQRLVSSYDMEILLRDEKIRREMRMALLAFGLGVCRGKYLISWGAGTNILFPEALARFYFDFPIERLVQIYGKSRAEIEAANKDKDQWYRKIFSRSRGDMNFYTTVQRVLPERVDTPEEVNMYLATFMNSIVVQM